MKSDYIFSNLCDCNSTLSWCVHFHKLADYLHLIHAVYMINLEEKARPITMNFSSHRTVWHIGRCRWSRWAQIAGRALLNKHTHTKKKYTVVYCLQWWCPEGVSYSFANKHKWCALHKQNNCETIEQLKLVTVKWKRLIYRLMILLFIAFFLKRNPLSALNIKAFSSCPYPTVILPISAKSLIWSYISIFLPCSARHVWHF